MKKILVASGIAAAMIAMPAMAQIYSSPDTATDGTVSSDAMMSVPASSAGVGTFGTVSSPSVVTSPGSTTDTTPDIPATGTDASPGMTGTPPGLPDTGGGAMRDAF